MLFIYREEYYLAFQKPKEAEEGKGHDIKEVAAFSQWQGMMHDSKGLAELVIAKQRHGSTGTVELKFEAMITKFSDWTD